MTPAPQRSDDAVTDAELDARLDGLGHEPLRRRHVDRRIVAVRPLAIDHERVVDRDVDLIRFRRDDDDLGPLLPHCQVPRLFELSRPHRQMAQRLDARHDLGLLAGKGDAERLRPFDMLVQHRDDLREGH